MLVEEVMYQAVGNPCGDIGRGSEDSGTEGEEERTNEQETWYPRVRGDTD